tara:strand:+ start:225 stop:557 length:333 start_codon:yes stop_codon:yes gene_type:complete
VFSKIKEGFSEEPAKRLLILVLIDLVATMIWYGFFGIAEANPFLIGSIKQSLISFTLLKLILSLPGIWILNKYQDKLLSKLGLALLSVVYFGVYLIHCYVMISLISFTLF